MPQICDMAQDGFYFPSEERHAEYSLSPWKIRLLRLGLNPRTWAPKASTLPLDHWSRYPASFFLSVFMCFVPQTQCMKPSVYTSRYDPENIWVAQLPWSAAKSLKSFFKFGGKKPLNKLINLWLRLRRGSWLFGIWMRDFETFLF
jgi:hypothetical protein